MMEYFFLDGNFGKQQVLRKSMDFPRGSAQAMGAFLFLLFFP
jgi:hypothetical protein